MKSPDYQPTENDIFLSRDVLDKQIIDTNGARVVRVNDLELVRVNGTLYVGNVDIGMLGILRRLGVAKATRRLTSSAGIAELPDIYFLGRCGTPAPRSFHALACAGGKDL